MSLSPPSADLDSATSRVWPRPIPTRRTLAAFIVLVVIAVIASVLASTLVGLTFAGDTLPVWYGWAAMLGLLVAILLADLMVGVNNARQSGALIFERRVAHTIPAGVATQVSVKLSNTTEQARRVSLHDGYPSSCSSVGMPAEAHIPAGQFAQFRYSMTPNERGDLTFEPASIRVLSPLGFWQLATTIGAHEVVRSFPNYAAVTRYALLAVDHRLSQIGVLKRRRRGEGMDFHQLRDYRDGDSPRAIDWKATARRVKLISREYQDERDQQVLFLLDCSRRMNAKDEGISHFDHTLNAILLMTFVANRQGDAAGLLTFGGNEERFLAPKKSPATVGNFLNALYGLQPSLKTPDYYQAALSAGRRLNKRALIIVISNLRDEDEDGLSAAMTQLQRRHLVMFANLKEIAVEEALNPALSPVLNPPPHPLQNPAPVRANTNQPQHARLPSTTLMAHAAAVRYSAERDVVLAKMRARGVKLIDVLPQQLPMALVNRYLDLKQSGVM